MKRPNGPRRDDRFRSNNRARSIRYYYAMQSHAREHVACSSSQLHVLRRYTAVYTRHLLRKAPIIEEEGAEMALFNIRGQLAITSHDDCNHPLVIRRIASSPRLSIRNPAIFYPIKKRAELLPSRKVQLTGSFATSATTTGAGNQSLASSSDPRFVLRNAISHGWENKK